MTHGIIEQNVWESLTPESNLLSARGGIASHQQEQPVQCHGQVRVHKRGVTHIPVVAQSLVGLVQKVLEMGWDIRD